MAKDKRGWSLERHRKQSPQLDKTLEHWDKQHRGTLMLAIIGILLALFAALFLPIFNGHSVWDIYVTGPNVKVEAVYPSSNDVIRINYVNDGGTSLSNIEIRYSFALDKELKSGDLSTRYLEGRGDSGFFYINITDRALPNCNLATEYPQVSIFWDFYELICYYRYEVPFPENVCVPAEINVTFYSKEIPEGKSIIKYYPVAYHVFGIVVMQPAGAVSSWWPISGCMENEEQNCKPYELAENKESLQLRGTAELKSLKDTINNSLKLSKKYCKEGLMPAEWCVENNIN